MSNLVVGCLLDASNPTALVASGHVLLLLLLLLGIGSRILSQLLLVLVKHARGQALKDPFMAESIIGRHTLQWVPFKAATNQVNEGWIRNLSKFFHDIFESICFFLF